MPEQKDSHESEKPRPKKVVKSKPSKELKSAAAPAAKKPSAGVKKVKAKSKKERVKARQAALRKSKKVKKGVVKAKPKPKSEKKVAKEVEAKKKKVKKKDEEELEGEVEEEEEEVEIIDEEEEEEEEEEEYTVKQKPKLTKSEKNLLRIRRERKSKEPTFRRQEWFRYKRLGESYRKPRGLHSKMRKNVKYRPKMARIGYGTPVEVRGRHPSGFEEVLVHRPRDLETIDPKSQAARIAHKVGTRKRIAIEDKADELGIRILNRGSA
ncbi:MAG: 50S ribosomal protein L32e [Thermoplasmata archaeon]|nr:MAG: 50S ribosomal protein L32e [Thermoplasmata archaeon]